MKGRNTRRILLLAASVFVVAASLGYYFFNKGPVNVKNASGKKVEATELYQAFVSNSIAAQQNFNGKVLEVKGSVEAVTTNQENEKLVLLKTNESGAYINCTVEEKELTHLVKGDVVSVKGICKGIGEAEPDLGIKADL